jgi:tRNA U34 5-methylaminomethyl-2-thiouridine-forming methyltransferase MnmC
MERVLQLTADGSHTIAVPGLQVTYHSTHGAIQESRHVFIEAGLKYHKGTGVIKILEMGLGTGLNALLTFQQEIPVFYHSLELYPLTPEEASALNYAAQLGNKDTFQLIHSCPWEQDVPLTNTFTLHKSQSSPQEIRLTKQYDIVYYDAFAPDIQPALWTAAIFQKLYAHLTPGGILVTYCCKGIVRRALQSVGFMVSKLPGPPGKREILRAVK